MQKPVVTFLNHASFIIHFNNTKILIDPYLFGSAFNNGWSLLTEVDHAKQIDNITHIFYSHEHPDHFSIPFLKKIEPQNRKNITILYQHTYDKRIKDFCIKLGYKFIELNDGSEKALSDKIYLTLGKVPFYDSWVNFKIDKINILNVNDCVLENPKLVFEIKKKLKRKIDVLFTQFSYANFVNEDKQEKKALSQLEKIKIQDEVLNPTYIIPFASFIYFSHQENKFMNKNINSINETHNFLIKNCRAKSIILSPNEEWNLKDKNNQKSLNFWSNIYKNINKLNYTKNIKSYNSNELILESTKYIDKLKKNNNFFLIKTLYYFGFFPSINIHLSDINKNYDFSILKGLNEVSEINTSHFVTFSSETLIFIFNYDYGLDTLQVNARLKCDEEYFKKVIKCFILGSLNNTGRYLKFMDFYKYLNFNFILRGLEILNIKKNN